MLTVPSTIHEDTSTATAGAADPTNCGGGATVWFSFTPTTTESVVVDTRGSNYDTVLYVVTGTAGSFDVVACNDNINGTEQSAVGFTAQEGVTYYFVVAACCDQSGATGGDLVLNLRQAPAPITLHERRLRNLAPSKRLAASRPFTALTAAAEATDSTIEINGLLKQTFGRYQAYAIIDVILLCETTATKWSAATGHSPKSRSARGAL